MYHIIFTSLAKTLTGGSGYGIAAATPDCPRLAMEEVTKLAGYSEIYPASHASKDQNPVNYFFVKQSGFHILGRLSAAPNDYSGRSNYLGQFFILGADNLPECGPAALLKALPFIDRFEGQARYLPATSLLNLPNAAPVICASWQRWTGDSGWAGVVADQIQSGSQINILYGQACRGLESLNLLGDIFSLLPKSSKWQTTFSTHVEGFPKGSATKIRMLQEGDSKTQDFQKQPHLFDLTKKGWDLATDSPLVNQARTGIAQQAVLKIQPQAPAWPQKQFPTPLQPDLEIGNDQDWYTIQPEPLTPKGKNPQKIHVQPAPPPVLGKKTKPEISQIDPVANYQVEENIYRHSSLKLVLLLFLASLLFGALGFGSGFLFRTVNEEGFKSQIAKKEQESIDQKEIIKDRDDKLLDKDENEKKLNETIAANDKLLKNKKAEITDLASKLVFTALSLDNKSTALLWTQRILPNQKQPNQIENQINAMENQQALELFREEIGKINMLTFTSNSFFKSLSELDVPDEIIRQNKEKAGTLDDNCQNQTNLEQIKKFKDSFLIIQHADWFLPDDELKKEAKKRPIIDLCNSGIDQKIKNRIDDSTNPEILKELNKPGMEKAQEENRKKYLGKIKELVGYCKDSVLFFGIQNQHHVNPLPSFKIIHITRLADAIEKIEKTVKEIKPLKAGDGKDEYPSEADFAEIEAFIKVFKHVKKYKNSIAPKLTVPKP